jgi:hypothetical protein
MFYRSTESPLPYHIYQLGGNKKYLYLPTEDKGQEAIPIENVDDIYKYEEKIKRIIKRHANLELKLNIKVTKNKE